MILLGAVAIVLFILFVINVIDDWVHDSIYGRGPE
jgi:hypothetical protein